MSFEQAIADIISGRNRYIALDPHFLKPMCSGLALFGTSPCC